MSLRRLAFSIVLALASIGCGEFDPPPEPSVEGWDNGVMTTAPDEPFKLTFTEPFVRNTLKVKLVRAVTDAEGNLLDEGPNPDLEGFKANTLAAFDGARPDDEERTFGGTFDVTDRELSIQTEKAFSVSVPYLLLIEPGLEDLDGHQTIPRIRIPFTFQLAGGGPTKLPTGYYYFVLNVDYLATQIQTYVYMEIDPLTGIWRAIFTNANRLDALNSRPGCPSSCPSDAPVCALIPTPKCVKPSEKQTSLDQYVDFLPEPDPPNGYIFIADGFARDEANGSTAYGTAPFLIEVTVGTGGILVQAENTRISGEFNEEEPGKWRATGSLSVEVVKLNGVGKDPTQGTFEAMSLTDDDATTAENFGFPVPTNLDK